MCSRMTRTSTKSSFSSGRTRTKSARPCPRFVRSCDAVRGTCLWLTRCSKRARGTRSSNSQDRKVVLKVRIAMTEKPMW